MTAAALLILGSAFMLLAGVGLIRLPDLFLRMSATAKAATLGASLTVLGAAAHFGDAATAGKGLVIVFFLFLTAPVAAHKIGRAGYRRGAPLYEGTICDEAKGSLPRDESREAPSAPTNVP
ncbi:MAG: monovalent cation/H(+) antiporter subunit G [Acidobacteria bacterium]|nr:monovalent cation/H(+) antiporter subunit G [Acidobacteriota bacterium]